MKIDTDKVDPRDWSVRASSGENLDFPVRFTIVFKGDLLVGCVFDRDASRTLQQTLNDALDGAAW